EHLNDNSQLVKKELAQAMTKLACGVTIGFTLQDSGKGPAIDCDLLCCSLRLNLLPLSRPSAISASFFKPFFYLLDRSMPSSVKMAFIENIPDLFTHLNVQRDEQDLRSMIETLLTLMEDPDKDVRIAFSGNIRYVLESINCEEGSLNELLVGRIKKAYTNAKLARDNEMKDTLILTTGDIGRAAKGDLVPFALLHLLHCLLSKSTSVAGASYTEIRSLAAAKSMRLQDFFSHYKKPICKFLVESLHTSQQALLSGTPGRSSDMQKQEAVHHREVALEILSEIANVFDFPDLNRFLTKTLQLLLPYLAAKASPGASALIRTIAKQLNANRREILINNFKYIFSHLVCSCTKDELEKSLHYLKNETEIELGSLLRQDYQGLHNELLLRLGEHYQQVFNGLSILASFASSDDPYQGPRNITKPEIMALSSLVSLMKLMGPRHISSVRVKMMTTLRTGLRYKEDFPELCCRSWDLFVRCLDQTYLGSLLSHVIVALLPLLHIHPKETVAIFHYLIVENRRVRLRHFRMESLRSVIASMEAQEFLCSIDIQDTYLHVPIFSGHHRFLRFAVLREHFQFVALPFGLATAPRVFTKIMVALIAILRVRGLVLFPYLDDILIKAPSFSQAHKSLSIVLDTLARFGWLVNQKKSCLIPSQRIIFLGMLFDARQTRVFLPKDKRSTLCRDIRLLQGPRPPSLRSAMKVLGGW
ncbi:unnamed protein product, partial [Ranitomeya imitator]